ncbi:hypothetical protein JCM8097_006837 [Rhodosporidiobolus ruineniae]
MRLLGLLVGLLQLVVLSQAGAQSTNASHPPLFSPPPSSHSLPTLHTSLASLLPVLPHLSPPPEYTLLVTLATPAFKPLLYNWLCFLRYRAKWGQPATHNEHGERVKEPSEDERTGWEDTPKVLVITSDEDLAKELAEHGVVVWWLRSVDWDALETAEEDEDDDLVAQLDRQLRDDLFTNLRLLDLLLPSEPSTELKDRLTDKMIPWGSLHYQSLMLERSLAMSALVGALVESQKTDPRWKKEQDLEWHHKVMAHDWENEEPLELPPWVGVRGVLLVDNDAVWLSSPTPFISHYYRPTGSHPSIVYSPDMAPTTRNAWGTHTMPCACFFYSRVSDHGATFAAPPTISSYLAAHSSTFSPPEAVDPYLYSPADGAAEAWRSTAMCHISMLLQSLDTAKRQASVMRWHRAEEERKSVADQLTLDKPAAAADESGIKSLKKAVAPSFQATCLGPALFLSEQTAAHLPIVSHERWLAALGSGEVEDLLDLMDESGLATHAGAAGGEQPKTCLSLAQAYQTVCPAPPPPLSTLELLASYVPSPSSFDPSSPPNPRPHRPIRTEPLPYDLFPPGIRYFDGGLEPGAKPCVVHANYATGGTKEKLLRERGLWALVENEDEAAGERWTCSADVMAQA